MATCCKKCSPMKWIVFTTTIIIFQNVVAKQPAKIIGGEYTTVEKFPSMVSIRLYGKHTCGGSLITNRHVLTAAHCAVIQYRWSDTYDAVRKPKSFELLVGTNSTKSIASVHKVEEVHVHNGYDGSNATDWNNDIAILTLKEPVESSNLHKPIALPSADTPIGARGLILGWGYATGEEPTSELLKATEATIYDSKKCQERLGGTVHSTQLCGISKFGTGFCDGDSGGPFIVNNEVIGVISNSLGCAWGVPDVYTRVYSYLNWIRNITKVDNEDTL